MTIDIKQFSNKEHFPVLIREVMQFLQPTSRGTYVDCTFGAGGYSQFILNENVNKLIAIDRDPNALKFVKPLADKYGDKLQFFNLKFSNLKYILEKAQTKMVDGIVADIGVSTMQLKSKSRGFSIKYDSPLLMQMDTVDDELDRKSKNAYNFINYAKESHIKEVLLENGEEPKATKIAKAIVQARSFKKIQTTEELKSVIKSSLPNPSGDNTKVITRCFQAIRIYVNDELSELKLLLNEAISLLNVGGKLLLVSFHSLEDRIVKIFFNEVASLNNNKSYDDSRGTSSFTIFDKNNNLEGKKFTILTKKVVTAARDERLLNRKSRGGKLRVIMRVS